MSDTDWAVEVLGLKLTADQLRACRYLERAGQRYCVHFGYENAVELARQHWNVRRRERRRRR